MPRSVTGFRSVADRLSRTRKGRQAVAQRQSIRAGLPPTALAAILVSSSAGAAASGGGEVGYLLQQLLNAFVLASLYAVLAVAYALIYALTRRIVLVFGDFATLGASVAVVATLLLVEIARTATGTALFGALAAGVAAAGALGFAAQRLVFAALIARPSQAVLIASIGLMIAVQEYLRLVSGSREHWLAPLFAQPVPLYRDGGFVVQATLVQLGVGFAGMAAALSLIALMRWSGFGRRWRSCAQDPGLARLCGVNVAAVVAASFVIAAALAGLAGVAIVVYYGSVSFHMGLMLGTKALFAAVIGGLGSLGGAFLGALAVALLETFWSAYFDIAYRDVAVFGCFILLLALRPQGLVSLADRRDHLR